MSRRVHASSRIIGALIAGVVVLGAGWFVMQAPAPDAHRLPLAKGGLVVGADGTPLLVDVTGDGVEEVVFWRSSANSLVAMHPDGRGYIWESASFAGGFGAARAWALPGRLVVAHGGRWLSSLRLDTGAELWRVELGDASEACWRGGELWLTMTGDEAVRVSPVTGERLGAGSPPRGAARLTACDPIGGDRFPDQGEAKALSWSDWSSLRDADAAGRDVAPEPAPNGLSIHSFHYLPRSRSWLLYGNDEAEPAVPRVARAGTRGAPLVSPWVRPAAGADATGAQRGEALAAATSSAAFVVFSLPSERTAGVAGFDLASGRRRWEVQVAPDAIVAIVASEQHVALVVKGGSARSGYRDAFALMVLDAQTGAETARIGSAQLRR